MVAHDDVGSGPAVVLLHAGVADRRMWSGRLDMLAAAGYRAIAPDLPGFGETAASGAAPWAAVTGLLDDLGVHDAVLVGISFGGAVALRVAALAPERTTGLVLVSAPPLTLDPSPRLAAAWEAEESALDAGDLDAAVRAVVDAWTLPGAPAAVRDLVATMQRRAFALQAAPGDTTVDPPDPLDRDPSLIDGIEAPALVAVGEHDMPDFRDGARQFAECLPGSGPAVVIAGAGHLAPLETPAAFDALLLEFLERRVDA